MPARKIVCKLCNRTITSSAFHMHLKFKHQLSVQQYYDQFILSDQGLKYCPVCGKENKCINIFCGYSLHCSCKCAAIDEKTKLIRTQTCIDRYGEDYISQFHQAQVDSLRKNYGVENVSQIPEVRNKTKQTMIDRYGVECNFSSKDPLLNGQAGILRNYGDLQTYYACRSEKLKLTNLEKYGVENVFQSAEIKSKIKQTNLQRYNVEYPMQSKQIQEKSKQTALKHFGVEYPAQSEIVLAKQRQTCLEKYGVECYLQSDQCKEALHQYSLAKFGTDCIQQSEWFKQLMHDHYNSYSLDDWRNIAIKRSNTRQCINLVDGNSFDSSWEAKVFMFAKSYNYDIERIIPIYYFDDDNKQHAALIDFKINGRLVEVKGNHLLDGCYESQHILYKLNLYRQNNVLVITSNIGKYINDEKFNGIEFMDINDLKEIK